MFPFFRFDCFGKTIYPQKSHPFAPGIPHVWTSIAALPNAVLGSLGTIIRLSHSMYIVNSRTTRVILKDYFIIWKRVLLSPTSHLLGILGGGVS